MSSHSRDNDDESVPLVGRQRGGDDDTLRRSGSSTNNDSTSTPSLHKKSKSKSSKSKKKSAVGTAEEQLAEAKAQIQQEKAGKRKLFHSLVKLAKELKKTQSDAAQLVELRDYAERNWYEGGMWRAPEVLPGVVANRTQRIARIREPISLSQLFFNLVIVTAFTRVGVAVSNSGYVDTSRLLYFAIFWTVWSKEASYSTRFDTTDLSAQSVTLITCFVVLFGSLSVQAPMNSIDGTRVMMMAAFVALLNCLLHVRVGLNAHQSDSDLSNHVLHYAIVNVVMTLLESVTWIVGIFFFPVDWEYRWAIFTGGVVLALRVPRAFLANDFHAACSKRGVLFILLLGFLMQSVIVVASEFFEYQTPTYEQYSFIGAVCLMFFCIKLLYVDDSDTLAEDHALLVNRWAGFFFNVGQFCLLLSTTVMGSGLNLLTHSYMAATAALPSAAKALVCGGYAAVLLSTFFIKSMHLKRVPIDSRDQALFIGAYVLQTLVLFIVVGVAGAMALGEVHGFLENLMQSDIQLLFFLSVAALFVVVMSWLDEAVELALYASAEDSREFRVHPFGFWWCLRPEITPEEINALEPDETNTRKSLSVLSPLLGSSAADIKEMGYKSIRKEDDTAFLADEV